VSALPDFPLNTALQHLVLYADAALLVVEKQAGLLSVPGRGEDKQDCQMARLLPQRSISVGPVDI